MYKVDVQKKFEIDEELESYLNKWAAIGWELVSVRWADEYFGGTFVFRRSVGAQFMVDKDYACEDPIDAVDVVLPPKLSEPSKGPPPDPVKGDW